MIELNEKLLDEIFSLPSDLRAKLIDRILKSLNLPIQKEIDEVWAKEAEKLVSEIESGKVKPVSGDDVFKEIRNRLEK
jgi:putative addiction module component (TIGR02574 family)